MGSLASDIMSAYLIFPADRKPIFLASPLPYPSFVVCIGSKNLDRKF